MAAPITHVVLTAKVYDKLFKDKQRSDFFIGTLFPDIRYLNVIDRQKTHYDGLDINLIKGENSFLAGLKFHSLLDLVREDFILANDVYSWCPKSKYITQSLKLFEDMLLYEYINDWCLYREYLNTVLPQEIAWGVVRKDVERWHAILQDYFSQKPNLQTLADFTRRLGFSEEVISEIKGNLVKLGADERVVEIVKKLYKRVNSLILLDT